MKKLVIGLLVLGSVSLLQGCGDTKKGTNTSKEEVASSTVLDSGNLEGNTEGGKGDETKVTFDASRDREALENSWVKLLGAFTYADNKIGNITFNLNGGMSESSFASIVEWIDEDLGNYYDNLKEEESKAKEELRDLGVTDNVMANYYEVFNSIRTKQDKWVNGLRNLSYADISNYMTELNSEMLEYSTLSQQIGGAMAGTLKELGYNEEESKEILLHTLKTSIAEQGDPEDLQAIDSFK